MTQFLTRRELREAERKGLIVGSQDPSEEIAKVVNPDAGAASTQVDILVGTDSANTTQSSHENVVPEIPQEQINGISATNLEESLSLEAENSAVSSSVAASPVLLTRRQLRELEQSGAAPSSLVVEDGVSRESQRESGSVLLDSTQDLPTAEEIAAIEQDAVDEELEATEVDLDMPSADFTGTNLLAEPSTQSIILDVAPEAIVLSMETGEVAITGSIAILAEPATGSITGGLDGLALDTLEQQDAVTGIISVIEPISALSIINERVNIGVVPQSVLRRGWWRNWLIGLVGLLMAIAAILATITIINALGA